jgi:exosome complex component RRP4
LTLNRGSGTYEHNGIIYSSLVGYVAKTNKLVAVRPVKSRYKAKVGDIVVGRVSEVRFHLTIVSKIDPNFRS